MYKWYEWDSLASFDLWHDQIKTLLGLPKMSVDKNGNEVLPMVESYTQAREVESKFIARVETGYAEGLVETNLRPPKPPIDQSYAS